MIWIIDYQAKAAIDPQCRQSAMTIIKNKNKGAVLKKSIGEQTSSSSIAATRYKPTHP